MQQKLGFGCALGVVIIISVYTKLSRQFSTWHAWLSPLVARQNDRASCQKFMTVHSHQQPNDLDAYQRVIRHSLFWKAQKNINLLYDIQCSAERLETEHIEGWNVFWFEPFWSKLCVSFMFFQTGFARTSVTPIPAHECRVCNGA